MLALISDIHSNLAALQAVMADVQAQKADKVYCLGDVIGYGPYPRECLDVVAQWDRGIMGNHDYAVFLEPGGFNAPAERAVHWTRENLDTEPDAAARRRRWEHLAGLGVHLFENNVLFVHGSPRRPLHEYIFPDDPEGNMQKMAAIFDRFPAACFVGHTHMPGLFTEDYQFKTPAELDYHYELGERKAVINIGSVGQPRDRDPRACYVLFDGRHIYWRRIEYDIQATAKAIIDTPGLDNFNAARLRDGR